jgi:hypothetical protein
MRQTTGFCALRRDLLALTAASALWAVPAQAAEEDTQLWLHFNSVVPLADDAVATFEISPRARDGAEELLLTRLTVEVPAADWVMVGAGAAYIVAADGEELRGHQQVTLEVGPLALRTRVEQRLFEGESRAQLRLRQRVATNIRVAERTTLTGTAEVLYIARTENREEKPRVDSWRALAGVQQQLSPHLSVALNYLVMLSPREDAPDRLSHVPQVVLVFRP